MSWTWLPWAAAAASVGVGLFWVVKFLYLLPLERSLRQERSWAEGLSAFAGDLLETARWPSTPELLSDILQGAVDRFTTRFGGLQLFVWRRLAATEPASSQYEEALVCRTGLLADSDPCNLEVPNEYWQQAREPAGARWHKAHLWAWGVEGKLWGLLGAVPSDPGGSALKRQAQALKVLAAYFALVADKALTLWELKKTREQLEGGLSLTLERLDETNLQLIQRAKEMKTLKEVTDTISEHPGRPNILGAIVSIVAKALSADLCAFLLLDEKNVELVTQPGAYGLSGDEGSLYRIALTNSTASSVRVFKSGQPFMTGDAQNDPQVIAHYARLWKCHSLLVVPLETQGRRIGVLRVGSFQKNFFNEEHLRFVQLIAEEAAILVESAVMAKRLVEMNRQMAELSRMKDDFVSTVSHELKTPLTSIQGFLSVVLGEEAGSLTSDQKRFLGITKGAAERIGALIANLLDLSRLESGVNMEFEPVSLADLARDAVESRQWEAESRGIHLRFEAASDLPSVRGDPQWLTQVFDNLISNALKFTLENGNVAVSVFQGQEGLVACVSDTGVGVAKADQARVFEKFYRGRHQVGDRPTGTGLGLAICRTIIERHGGRIWVESEEGQGTKIFFTVPTSQAVEAEKSNKT